MHLKIIILIEINWKKLRTTQFHLYLGNKTKCNKQDRQKHTDTDNGLVVTRWKGGWTRGR